MEKLDFGDLSKFLVSAGVALVGAGVAVLWLAYREPFDLLVTTDVLEKVTPLAKQVLLDRQVATAHVVSAAPWVAGALWLAGGAMMAFGIRRWLPQQRAIDAQNELAGAKASRELLAMSASDVITKAQAEVEESESAGVGVLGPEGIPRVPSTRVASVTSSEVDELNQRVTRYLKTEETVLRYLNSVAARDYEVLPHRRIGSYTYDAVLRALRNDMLDVVVEIKDLQGHASLRYVTQAQALIAQSASIFSVTRSRKAIPLVVAVVDDERIAELLGDPLFAALSSRGASGLVRFIPRGRLNDLNPDDFLRLIDSSVQVDVLRTSGE